MSDVRADFDLDTPIDHNFHQQANSRVERWESSLPEEYWAYRSKWEENPKQKILEGFPIHLDIEATSACNLKCVMCPRTEMVEAGNFWSVKAFDLESYKRLIDEGVQQGLSSVKYNYLGEPLLNKNIVEMIEYAKQAGVLDVMFNTNAALLDEKTARALIESGLDKLFFSFDSPDSERYERIRVGASYDQVLSNIKNFMQIREEMKAIKPFTRVSMVLMQENQQEWEDFQRLFSPIVDAVAYVDYLDHSGQSNPDRAVVAHDEKESNFCCPQLWQRMFIHPDGVVTPCCIDSARELVMGNIHENSAGEIWQGEVYQQLRERHSSGRYAEVYTCAHCPLAHY